MNKFNILETLKSRTYMKNSTNIKFSRLFLLILSLLNIKICVFAEDSPNVEWVKNFGGSSEDIFNMVTGTDDGGIVAVGYSESSSIDGLSSLGGCDGIIVKYDSSGNKSWSKIFGGSDYDYFESVVETRDGGLAVAGYTYSTDISGLTNLSTTSYTDAIIVKYDSNGKQLWVKNFGGSNNDYFESITETDNGDLVVVGRSSSSNISEFSNLGSVDAIIVKYDSLGNRIWAKNFGGSSNDYFYCVTDTADDGLVTVGNTTSTDISGLTSLSTTTYYDAIIVKYNSSGNKVWAKNFGGSNSDYFESVIETNDNSLIVVGYTKSTDISGLTYISTTNYYDSIIIKYDSSGNKIWAKNFGVKNSFKKF